MCGCCGQVHPCPASVLEWRPPSSVKRAPRQLPRLHMRASWVRPHYGLPADKQLLGPASGYAPGWGAPSSAGPAAGQLSRLHMRELMAQLSAATGAQPSETVRPMEECLLSCQCVCWLCILWPCSLTLGACGHIMCACGWLSNPLTYQRYVESWLSLSLALQPCCTMGARCDN